MATTSVHVSQHIDCPADVAYAYARDPANLPAWAAGLGGSIAFVDGQWRASSAAGEVVVEFVPVNELGVLDHTVVLSDGTSIDNPMRVLPDGEACEVVFTLRRQPSMTDRDFDEDAAAVARDLVTLKRVLESARGTQDSASPQ